MLRLDKYLAQMSIGTRSEVKRFIKSGRVFVNGVRVRKPEQKVEMDAVVLFDGEPVVFEAMEYYMLNKPRGVVSATKDKDFTTVVSLIRDSRRGDLFPVGRLDKDTEGLLLITNDGALAHELLAPGKHVWKSYLVEAEGLVTEEDVRRLEEGIDIGEKKATLPARVKLWQETVPDPADKRRPDHVPQPPAPQRVTWLELAIREGRYHQVKRMMAAVGHPVLYLKRLSMGSLRLDENLKPGEYRRLTGEELAELKTPRTNAF